MLLCVADDLRTLPPAEIEAAMCKVRMWAGQYPNRDLADGPRALTCEELQRLAASPHIEIGAHTVSHPVLSLLSPVEQRREIHGSRADLQRMIGRPVTTFSYPHGAYSAQTLSIVGESGFSIACCSTADVLSRRSHALAVPRLWVSDQSGAAFGRWLASWLPA
jgi:peptidoglycan/xylan/chitin deacetylase (PgdA/CDA1 family)